MKFGQVKVTIVGYYLVSDEELGNYGIEEFDVAAMAKVDSDVYQNGGGDAQSIIDWFTDGRPTSVTFEAVDDSDVDPNC
jgi:hypothetical protein